MTTHLSRLPATRTLHDVLPKGREGGLEFARIVDLLLFAQAQSEGSNITLFSDAAGDFSGLDSFHSNAVRIRGKHGFQYKFYPSPLSAAHRSDIRESLEKAYVSRKTLHLRRWILVTPQDLVESSSRKDGGDVTWLEGLRQEFDQIEIEHWGHTKLQSLFLQSPSLALFYYPELVANGLARKSSIEATRKAYDSNLTRFHRNIEFVGMSVYKPEATRGIPMEHIYIPLGLESEDDQLTLGRINPLELTHPGKQSVVLGDPGSGKSTLLRFLALAGLSKPIQQRYGSRKDSRLPVLITLRRYADELKSRSNLPLIEFIREHLEAEFSCGDIDRDFIDYYLRSGKAILLFDGLDELPSGAFKSTVRDRIQALAVSYPGNTIIVSSRIVGYEDPFRFDGSDFNHFRVSSLELPEMEQFVRDWYKVRIPNDKERDASVNDLIRILRDEDNEAIKQLARNPLLLTIVALVHRIDAVLPDERVVLYQKCTETLLNTWHTWKFREVEVKHRGRIERRNRRRMEAIAFWMHCRAGGTGKNERAVVPSEELVEFLSDHIHANENSEDKNEAEDLAREFLEFVHKRAGLLIEIGDEQFSFVHLTFQEYLTSTHILTSSETKGAASIWPIIRPHCGDPRWHEVIRLIVAGLQAETSQRHLVQAMLAADSRSREVGRTEILVGLLIDSIQAAEAEDFKITAVALEVASRQTKRSTLISIINPLRKWQTRSAENHNTLLSAAQSSFEALGNNAMSLALAGITAGLSWTELSEKLESEVAVDLALMSGAILAGDNRAQTPALHPGLVELFVTRSKLWALDSPEANFISAAAQAALLRLAPDSFDRASFDILLFLLTVPHFTGPPEHFVGNLLELTNGPDAPVVKLVQKRRQGQPSRQPGMQSMLASIGLEKQSLAASSGYIRKEINRIATDLGISNASSLSNLNIISRRSELAPVSPGSEAPKESLALEALDISRFIATSLNLQPRELWAEALRRTFVPTVQGVPLYHPATWESVRSDLVAGQPTESVIWRVAALLLLDAHLHLWHNTQVPVLAQIARGAERLTQPAIRLALCMRRVAFESPDWVNDWQATLGSNDQVYWSLLEEAKVLPLISPKALRVSK